MYQGYAAITPIDHFSHIYPDVECNEQQDAFLFSSGLFTLMSNPVKTQHIFPIDDIFGGVFESIINCFTCGSKHILPPPSILDHSVSIENYNSIDEALHQLFNERIVEFSGSKCGPNQEAAKLLFI